MNKVIVIGAGHMPTPVDRILAKEGLDKLDVILVDNPESLDFKDIRPTKPEIFPIRNNLKDIQPLIERVTDYINDVPKWAKGKKCEKVGASTKIDRNKPCPCGSNKKAKKCCHG